MSTTWQRAAAAAVALIAGATSAYAATSGPRGTVNAYTAKDLSRARQAAREADYQPIALAFAQDGNIFLTATRDQELYQVTVTPAEKLYASTGLPLKPGN